MANCHQSRVIYLVVHRDRSWNHYFLLFILQNWHIWLKIMDCVNVCSHLCRWQSNLSQQTSLWLQFAVQCLMSYLADVAEWMSRSQLKLNVNKTQVTWLGSRQQLVKITITDVIVRSSPVEIECTVKDLGMILNERLFMAPQVAAICHSGYYQLCQLQTVIWSLITDAKRAVVQAFVFTCMDYCNSLLYSAGEGLMKQLQSL